MKWLSAVLVLCVGCGLDFRQPGLGVPLLPEMMCTDVHTLVARDMAGKLWAYPCAGGCTSQHGVLRCDVAEELAGSPCAWAFEGKQACSRPEATIVCDREMWRYVSFEPCTLDTYVEAQ